ncbi:MAG: OmpA family protein [Myxococcaceae bacterium]
MGPQQAYFEAGAGAAARVTLALSPNVDAEARLAYLVLAAQAQGGFKNPGGAFTAGPGLRLGLPRATELFFPWVDLYAVYARTGPLSRAGMDAGLGVHFRLRPDDRVWFGISLRYLRILGLASSPGFESHDASILLVGLSAELDSPKPPADRDGDEVADAVDACPVVRGAPGRTDGCPAGQEVVVTATRLALGREISFLQALTALDPASYPLLEEVANTLKHRSGIELRIEGHSAGDLELARGRAAAIREYLIGRGVAPGRLTSEGYANNLEGDWRMELIVVEPPRKSP